MKKLTRVEHCDRRVRAGSPDVILDFFCEGELLFVEVKNIGPTPALNIKTKFDSRFTGINGELDITTLAMFRQISFLSPSRGLQTFIDTRQSYFARKQPHLITATLRWIDREGFKYSSTIVYDLRVFKDLLTAANKPTDPFTPGENEAWQNNKGGQ
ncbi:MAG: hypothetical protein HY961_18150 [Ignavibacteriae bacterium]|nr:hypothetical protein [Ignavibacteriota bacterium]